MLDSASGPEDALYGSFVQLDSVLNVWRGHPLLISFPSKLSCVESQEWFTIVQKTGHKIIVGTGTQILTEY